MKASKVISVALLILCVALCLAACGKTKKPEQTTPGDTTPPATSPVTPPVEMVDIIKDGASAYRIIQPQRPSIQGISNMTYEVYSLAGRLGVSLQIKNDQTAPEGLEILVGNTNRAATQAIVSRLGETANADSFYYVVAELDGQVVLYATDPVAYGFLATYFEETYVKNGGLSLPKGLYDLQSMTWVAYEEHLAELERLEQEKQEAERRAKVEALKKQIKNFDASSFGALPKTLASPYGAPSYTPAKGAHPRVWITPETLPTVKANLSAPENKAAYDRYIALSETETDGLLPAPSTYTYNMDYNVLAAIEAKAFRYALTGEEFFGYEAILAIKNYMKSVVITSDISDNCRAYGYVMFIGGCVYDWCYDLLSATDKNQIIAGMTNLFCENMEVDFPPSKQGGVTGHGSEAQVLRDYFVLSIAIADERPDFYEYVAGRIEDVHVPPTDYFSASGSHWQGANYGPHRYHWLLVSETLARAMSGGKYSLYNDTLGEIATTLLHYERPDGQALRIGDSGVTDLSIGYAYNALLAGWLYGDQALVSNAYDMTGGFSKFGNSGVTVTAPMFLALHQPELMEGMSSKLELVRYSGSPLGSIIARSSWNDKDAVLVYMKIGESYSANHEHKDAGNFQIYYKGILAQKSGAYDTYVNEHGAGYYRQTISNNCMLVYNPNLSSVGSWIYSGGQSIHKPSVNGENATLAAWQKKTTIAQAKIIGNDYLVVNEGAEGEEYIYSYLAGDLTNAYDAETVEAYSRYMISVMTGDPENPMAFLVYDRITSVDASYKKTFLLHVPEDPTIDDVTNTAIVTNTNTKSGNNYSGKLFVQSLLDDVTYSEIGGEGKYFWVNDRNIELYSSDPDRRGWMPAETSKVEVGWGRIEISPKEQSKTDRLLTVMYVTDAKNTAAQTMAGEIKGETFVGATLFGKAVLFPTNAGAVTETVTVSVSGSGEYEYYIAGMSAGRWAISVGGTHVTYASAKKDGILRFTAPAGELTLSPAFSKITYELGGGEAGASGLPATYDHGQAMTLPTDVSSLGNEFLGWYTTPDFRDGSEIAVIPDTARDDITVYAKWKHVFDAIRYEGLSGGTIVGDYPTKRVEGESITLPSDVTRSGYYFLGWFTSSDFAPESRIKVIDSSYPTGHVTVYAAWGVGFVDEKYNGNQIDLGSQHDDKTVGELQYVINGALGSSFKTVTEGGESYLRWSASKDASSINLLGDLAEKLASAETSLLTVSVDLAKLDGTAALGATMRLRGAGGAGAGESTPIFHISEDGSVYLGQGTGACLATLDGEFTSIAVTVDFEKGQMIGYADGAYVRAVSFATPETSAVKGDTAAWLASLHTYVFNWFGRESTTESRALLVDDLAVYAGVYAAN